MKTIYFYSFGLNFPLIKIKCEVMHLNLCKKLWLSKLLNE